VKGSKPITFTFKIALPKGTKNEHWEKVTEIFFAII